MKTSQTKKSRKSKDIKLEITYSNEPCTREESIQHMAKLCMLLIECDREWHRKQLEVGDQYCSYCGKKITKLDDFYSPDNKNACLECAKKVVDNPKRQKTFCGIPVRD